VVLWAGGTSAWVVTGGPRGGLHDPSAAKGPISRAPVDEYRIGVINEFLKGHFSAPTGKTFPPGNKSGPTLTTPAINLCGEVPTNYDRGATRPGRGRGREIIPN